MSELPNYFNNAHGTTFHELPGSVVILSKGGVYKQSSVYHRGGWLYAKHGSGFVQLKKHGTSVPNLMVDGIDLGDDQAPPVMGKTGRLAIGHAAIALTKSKTHHLTHNKTTG